MESDNNSNVVAWFAGGALLGAAVALLLAPETGENTRRRLASKPRAGRKLFLSPARTSSIAAANFTNGAASSLKKLPNFLNAAAPSLRRKIHDASNQRPPNIEQDNARARHPPPATAPFVNEPYTDFSQPANATNMRAALAKVRAQFGKEYDLLIAGERRTILLEVRIPQPVESLGDRRRPPEGIGERRPRRSRSRLRLFPYLGCAVHAGSRQLLFRAAEILRERKYEFDAWLVFESGKTWAEAEADVSEAIDFCEYYARHAMKLAQSG